MMEEDPSLTYNEINNEGDFSILFSEELLGLIYL